MSTPWTLDGIEGAAEPYAVRRRPRDNREPSTRGPALGMMSVCWCGEASGHNWPGKADGGPHPRVVPEGLRRPPAGPGEPAAPSLAEAGAR